MRKSRFIPLPSVDNPPPHLRMCEQHGCKERGEFRAPKSPSQLREYYWFCLSHVQQYNKAWDYYKGMSSEEIDASRTSDVTWNRPSWPLGGWRPFLNASYNFESVEPLVRGFSPFQPSLPESIQQALEIFELALPLTIDILKKQYKQLVKRYHPDLHAGDKEAEERLKDINDAYQTLKKHFFSG